MIQLIALMAALFSLNAFSKTTSLIEDLKNQNRELQKIIDKNNQIIRKKIGSTSQTIRKKKVRRTAAPNNEEQLLMGDLNDFFRKMPNRTVPQNFMIGTGISTIEGMTATSNNYGSYSEMFYIAPALIVGWQVLDNVWIEGSYARRVASDVPSREWTSLTSQSWQDSNMIIEPHGMEFIFNLMPVINPFKQMLPELERILRPFGLTRIN